MTTPATPKAGEHGLVRCRLLFNFPSEGETHVSCFHASQISMACAPLVKSLARSCIGIFLRIPLAFLRPEPGRHTADPDRPQLYPNYHQYVVRPSEYHRERVSHR